MDTKSWRLGIDSCMRCACISTSIYKYKLTTLANAKKDSLENRFKCGTKERFGKQRQKGDLSKHGRTSRFIDVGFKFAFQQHLISSIIIIKRYLHCKIKYFELNKRFNFIVSFPTFIMWLTNLEALLVRYNKCILLREEYVQPPQWKGQSSQWYHCAQN